MNYKEYSYSKRNEWFVLGLMDYIIHICNIKTYEKGLSIGSEDGIHEKAIERLHYNKPIELNDKEKYDAEWMMIPYEDNTFDYVFIKSVIEHICNTDLFLSEIYRVLKPGGKVIILTPDYQKQKDFFYDDYTHIKPFTLNSLKMAVQLNGFGLMIGKWFYYYKKIWEDKMFPNGLNCRVGYWLTEKTGIKYFRWGSDRQLFVVGAK
jgi:SAM-dependent methyltransferase